MFLTKGGLEWSEKGVRPSTAKKHENEDGRMWRQNPKGVCVHPNKAKTTGSG